MTEINYYFQNKEQRKLEKLINKPLFNQLIHYFLDHQNEEIILRELKRVFNNEKNFEQFLEELIQFGLIRREERRYALDFPLFHSSDLQEKHSEQANQLWDNMKEKDSAEQIDFYGRMLWEALFSNENSYFFGIEKAEGSTFYEREEAGNSQLKCISIHKKGEAPFNLAGYFAMMKEAGGDHLSAVYQPLQELIGDVDSEYFAAQAYRIIRAVMKKRKMADRRNIFLEALTVTNCLEKTENGWELLVPIITEENRAYTLELEPYLNTFQQITNTNERVLKKHLFYQSCLDLFMEKNWDFSYFEYS